MAVKQENKVMDLINSLTEVKKNTMALLMWGIPEEVKKHLLVSYKERLLAIRALIDSAINRMEAEKKSEKKNPQKVDIE
jgi:hypothetical protein